jgi:hypothetical protein
MALLVLAVAVLFPGGAVRAANVAGATAAGPAFTKTITVSRDHLNPDGTTHHVDSKTVTLSVSQTDNLRGRQLIDVTWSGAHQTGGIAGDPNASSGRISEYPVVLLQCRGIDSAAAPVDQRLDPTTCWTQTPDQRYQSDNDTAFPAWRLDRYAAASDRHVLVGAPTPDPCPNAAAQRLLPFVGADGTAYYAGNQCGRLPPEGVQAEDPAAPPSNTTYGATLADGTGSAKFAVWTAQQNSSLGCSNTVPCALVAIPVMGISCDVAGAALPPEDRPPAGEQAAAKDLCEKTGQFKPGDVLPINAPPTISDRAVSGALWWSASNWRNRITVPLTFAPAANVCDILDSRTPVDLYGSELASQLTDQWASAFCQDPRRFKFRHVRTGEPLAKAALANKQVSAALISRAPSGGYTDPTVNAPIAVSGFAVSYAVDDVAKHEHTELKLTPRLLAKLLSESYPAFSWLKTSLGRPDNSTVYKVMANNPLDMADDPEFVAINPGLGHNSSEEGASTLLTLSGNSDVVFALTSYINADPEARAFLDGKPDPWGMVVNPGYKGIALPQESWPLLDGYLPPPPTISGTLTPCMLNAGKQVIPVPILPLVAAPMSSLAVIAQAAQFAVQNSSTRCADLIDSGGTVVGGTFKPKGRQQPGSRFMLSVTALADAPRFGLRAAALQTTVDAGGRHFVAPTDDSLRAAMKLTVPDDTTHTWPIPYATLRGAKGVTAYPGTMVVYAAVPTSGLFWTVAQQLAQLLDFAATDGQLPGLSQGRLPPGYLPMTAANGLSALAAYTRRAAEAVAAQRGAIPAIVEVPGPPPGPVLPGGASPAGPSTPAAGLPPTLSPTPELSPWKPGVSMPIGYTSSLGSLLAGWALPVVVLFGLACALTAMLTRSQATRRVAARLRSRLTHLAELGGRR